MHFGNTDGRPSGEWLLLALRLARKFWCPRGDGPEESRLRSEGWEIPVARPVGHCGGLGA